MSLYTNWVCFDCCKSFRNFPLSSEERERKSQRKCPDCQKPTIDMGVYFEPPRRQT